MLLILAGIALNLTIGQNGIFTRAQKSVNTWRNAETNEQLAMGELEKWMANYMGENNGDSDNEDDIGKPVSEEDLGISAENVYYADLDSTGEITVDGVIFADLAGEKESGEWGSSGVYTIPSGTNLKKYYIKGEYTDEHFGTGKVIAPIEGNDESKKDRFYVTALEDINPGTYYCWYDAAYGKLDKTVELSENDFGQGRENTEYVNNKWNDASLPWGAHNDNPYDYDMWGVIQEEITSGWFVPSKSEWAAFAKAFEITSSNYSSKYGLSYYPWSSSQNSTYYAYIAGFGDGYIGTSEVSTSNSVRLATTF